MEKQKTIAKPVSMEGIGLHTGKLAHVTIKPAAVDQGIMFVRTDRCPPVEIVLNPKNMVMDADVTRCTAIGYRGVKIFTIEHLLAALHGLGIDNAVIDIDAEEVPGMDGSSLEFVRVLEQAGIVEQDAPRSYIEIKEPISISNGDASISITPAQDLVVSYTLDYPHPQLRHQVFTSTIDERRFKSEISSARTFCLESEVPLIKGKGLGKGATPQNSVVMGDHGPIENVLRFDNECCRHKVLDIVGDFYLLGKPLRGNIVGHKSGHALNRQLVYKIMEQMCMGQKVYDINAIMKLLPHRYPFLLVDRVSILEEGKRGLGIKNVTINDGFFQGHFPQKPIMPGVLMIEAMAQTAGVLVLTSGAHPDKVALFMSIDNVKFRRVVIPGDQLEMDVEIIRDRERTAHVKGIGRVNGEIAVEAEMLFSYADMAFLNG